MPRAPAGWRTSKRPPWKVPVWRAVAGQRRAQRDGALARVDDRADRDRGGVGERHGARGAGQADEHAAGLRGDAERLRRARAARAGRGPAPSRRAGSVPGVRRPGPSRAAPGPCAAGRRRRGVPGGISTGAVKVDVGAERQAVVVAGDEARVVGRALEQPRHHARDGDRVSSCRSWPAGWSSRRRWSGRPRTSTWSAGGRRRPCRAGRRRRRRRRWARASAPPARSRPRPGPWRPPARTAAASAREHGHDRSTKPPHDQGIGRSPQALERSGRTGEWSVDDVRGRQHEHDEPEHDAIGGEDRRSSGARGSAAGRRSTRSR